MSSFKYKSLAARASAVLTTSEVAASTLTLNKVSAGKVSVHVAFTLGMLTNVVLRPYVSMDGTNFVQLANPASTAGAVLSQTPTADYVAALTFDCQGWKFFRMSAQGTGTVTNSLLALTYRHLLEGAGNV